MSYDVVPYEVALETKQPNKSVTDLSFLQTTENWQESKLKSQYNTPVLEKSYDGSKYMGKKHGYGAFVTSSNYKYEGEFDLDLPGGFGKLVFPDGSEVKGFWSKNGLEGTGYEKWADGSSYEGEYKNGLKHGQGEYKWSENLYYKGSWVNDLPDGKVCLIGNLCYTNLREIRRPV